MTPQQSQFKADRFSNYAYAVIVPQSGASYAEQAADIVAQIQQHFANQHIVRQTIFLRDADRLDEVAQLFAAQQGAAQPLSAFVSQAPADGNLLAAEIVAVSGAEVNRINNSLTTVQHNGITFVHTQADVVAAAFVRFIGLGISLRPFGFFTLAKADFGFAPRGDAPAATQVLLVFRLCFQV